MPSIHLLHDSALAAALRADVEAIIGPVVNLSLQTGRAAYFGAGDLVLQGGFKSQVQKVQRDAA